MTIVKKTTLVALVIALTATSGIVFAQDNSGASSEPEQSVEQRDDSRAERRGNRAERRSARMMERLDQDDSGDISVEEFGARRIDRLSGADADGDGILTVEEITEMMEQRRAERREARILRRFDIDGDGEITIEEQELQQEKRFALLDRDNDGVLSAEEMPRGGKMGPGGNRKGGNRMGGHHGGMGWHHGR